MTTERKKVGEEHVNSHWWLEFDAAEKLRVLISPRKQQPSEDTVSEDREQELFQSTRQIVRELAEYLQATYPENPLTALEAAGFVLSTMTPPQCEELIIQPFVENIAPADTPMEDIGTENWVDRTR